MPNPYKVYMRELQQLNDAFAQIDRYGTRIELDTDEIEEVLEDWQDLVGELYADGESSSRKLAQSIENQLEYFEERLETYIEQRISYEEEDAIKQAGTRLTQSRIENYHHSLKKASENPDVMRYYRVSDALQVPDECSKPKKRSRLELPPRNRLALDDD
ncbi:MAG: hypothetical protein AAF846_02310 [Chloroflexota bacterium]